MGRSTERDWRCRTCAKLLGKYCEGQIYLEYGRRYRNAVEGKVTAVCPKCSTLNTTRSEPDQHVN